MSSPDIGAEEREAVLAVLNTPNLSMGPELGLFEAAVKAYTAVGFRSGSALGRQVCIYAYVRLELELMRAARATWSSLPPFPSSPQPMYYFSSKRYPSLWMSILSPAILTRPS